MNRESKIKVLMHGCYSTDPLLYDSYCHHILIRSVVAPLVSNYGRSGISEGLASSWVENYRGKSWTFYIRPNLKFENGKPINPEAIVLSLKRLAFLMKNKNSRSEVFDNLVGIQNFNAIGDEIEGGLIADNSKNTVQFNFVKPVPRFLEIISFGLYGIVSSEDFEAKTGKWKNENKISSSYNYKLNWKSENNILLEKREDQRIGYLHKNSYKRIELNNSGYVNGGFYDKYNDYDIQSLHLSFDGEIEGYNTIKSPYKDSIFYVHFYSFLQHPLFKDKGNRQIVMARFYNELKKRKLEHSINFFDMLFKGGNASLDKLSQSIEKSSELKFLGDSNETYSVKLGMFTVKVDSEYVESVTNALESALTFSNVDVERVEVKNIFKHGEDLLDPENPKKIVDIKITGTGVLVENPQQDLMFMFLSKQGIRLPDVDKNIKPKLLSRPFNTEYVIDHINQALLEGAAIWPITNFWAGYLAAKEVDMTNINTSQPPIDFSYIGEK